MVHGIVCIEIIVVVEIIMVVAVKICSGWSNGGGINNRFCKLKVVVVLVELIILVEITMMGKVIVMV